MTYDTDENIKSDFRAPHAGANTRYHDRVRWGWGWDRYYIIRKKKCYKKERSVTVRT